MGNEIVKHEWISDYKDFVAVLACKNQLEPWDKDRCLRAFQTFKWDDASSPGGDMCFKHEETGALVRHDGAVVAIDTLHDGMEESLQDLFRVLHGLGWHTAEVYHPVESMSLMLKDIGKAIPANLDFDIKPADSMVNVSNFAEKDSLMARGLELLGKRGGNSNSVVLQEMESMGLEIAKNESASVAHVISPVNAQVVSGGAFDQFELEDDDDMKESAKLENHNEVPVHVPDAAVVDNIPTAPISADYGFFKDVDDASLSAPVESSVKNSNVDLENITLENEQLRVELEAAKNQLLEQVRAQILLDTEAQETKWTLAKETAKAHAQELAMTQADNEGLLNQVNDLQSELVAASEREDQAGEKTANDQILLENLMSEVEELRHQIADLNEVEEERNILEETGNVIMKIDVVKIGKSVFCFDFPEAPVSVEAVDKIALDYGIEKIVSLNVGAINQNVRWNVLGEISEEYPWQLEKLVFAMGFSEEHRSLIASILLDLNSTVPNAQLRDLLKICASSGVDTKIEFNQMLEKKFSSNVNFLFSRLDKSNLLKLLDEVVMRLSPIMLCGDDESFVDIRSDNTDLSIMTVRGLLNSSQDQLFVVHVDSLDGPFVTAIADLLRIVVSGYGATARYEADSNEDVVENEANETNEANELDVIESPDVQGLPEVKASGGNDKTMNEFMTEFGALFQRFQRKEFGG